LPLNPSSFNSVSMTGPNAADATVMEGNYYGDPPFIYSALTGLYSYILSTNVLYTPGCTMSSNQTSGFAAAETNAKQAQVSFLVMGLNQNEESEGNDRISIALPGVQNQLIDAVANASSGPVILILLNGGCVDVSQWQADPRISAIVWAGYPGMYGGLAIFDVIFGTVNPSGMLTQTWYLASYVDQVLMKDMNMRPSISDDSNPGRGYRYYPGQMNYGFGFGLSYSTFNCKIANQTSTTVTVQVSNLMSMEGATPALVYWVPTNAGVNGMPLKRLVAFDKAYFLTKSMQTLTMHFYEEFLISGEMNLGGSLVCHTLL